MSSEWCSAPFTVPKPPPADQSSRDAWRLVVDYRALNAATVPDAHPLPLIEKEIAARAKGKLFTVLDLRDGFHQMPLRKEDRHLTAMCTPCGTDQWTVLPMGLKNAPSMFQKMMETILFQKHKSLDLQEFCSIYIDDLLIATPLGKNFDECLKLHEEQVRKVLEVLRQEKLVCGPKKGKMFLQSVEFCGSVLEDGTRRPAPGKMAALQLWERPKTITQLRAFLGCCNYYHGFLPLYAKFSGPLTELLKVGKIEGKKGSQVKLKWTPECEEAFTGLKEALANVVTLKTPWLDGRPFYIRTDASRYAIGATIEQVDDEGHHHPLAFWSRKLTTRQRNWSPRGQEAYAILCALRRYEGWILGHRVEVLTDHKSLESWRTEHVDTPGGPAGRRGRWHETLSRFDLHVTYIPGRYNTVADALSRWAYPALKAYSEVSFHGTATDKTEVIEFDKEEQALIKKHCLQCSIKNRMKVDLVRCKEITKADQTAGVNSDSESSLQLLTVFPLTRSKSKSTLPPQQKDKETSFLYVDWTKMYKEDRFFGSVYHKLKGDKPYDSEETSDFKIQGDKLFWQGRICVPDCLIDQYVKHWHRNETAHTHSRVLEQGLRHRVYTRDLKGACERVAKGCKQCQATIPKNQKAEGLLKGLPIPERLFDKVTADVFELGQIQEECLYTRKPIDRVLLIQDRHSGYIQALPCNTKHLTSEMAAKWTASQWMSNWDVPSEILTDSGKEFIGTWWENMCALLGVHHLRARVYDHRALPAERAGRILISILRKFLATEKDYNWLETIYCVLRRYHRTKNYTGLSPNELFGREKMGPGPVMYHPRQCYDASQWLEKIKDLESKWIKAKVESQADWLNFKNKSRTQGKPFEKGQQVWLRKSDDTLKDDNKLLPLLDGPFQVKSQLSETTFNIEIEPGRHQEVHRDRLKAEVPCPKGRFKPLYWTSKYVSDRKMVTSSFELEKILEYKKNARGKWYFLCGLERIRSRRRQMGASFKFHPWVYGHFHQVPEETP